MLNLVGQNLGVTVPVSVLKKMGHIDGTERIQEFFEKMSSRIEHVSSKERKQTMEEYSQYLSNIVFVPTVITNMVENNLNISDAITNSQEDIHEASIEMSLAFAMIDIIPGISEMINSIIEEITQSLSGVDVSSSDSNKFSCTIKEVSEDFWAELERIGIVAVSENISNMEKVTETIQSKLITPVFNAIYKCVLDMEDVTDEDLDDDERAELKETIDDAAATFSTNYIIQTVVSTVLTKAIEENITMEKAMAAYEENELAVLAVESIIFSDDLASYAEQLEKVMKTVFNLVA